MDARVVLILAVLGIAQCKLIYSCKETRSFVDGHNERRLQLAKGEVAGQPAASRMTYIIWDDELATKAQEWASKNTLQPNTDKNIPSNRFTTGENLFLSWTTDMDLEFDPEIAMKLWWDSYQNYTYSELTEKHFDGSVEIGGYTQMAWAKSIYLGCGVSQSIEDDMNIFYVVCNYGPAGNYLGKTPYEIDGGASGSLVCGDDRSDCTKKYGNFC